MPWYAFDAVDDALAATRNFLLPFTWGRWLRLAVIVFFLGGGSSGISNVSNVPSSLPSDGGTTPGPTPTMSPDFLAAFSELTGLSQDLLLTLGLTLLAVGAVVVLALIVVSAVMPFVFVDALRTNDVRIRGPFKRRFGKGMRLLGFQVGLTLLLVLPVVAITAAAVVGAVDPTVFTSVGLGGLLAVAMLVLAGAVVVGLFFGFTRQFVIPVMIATDSGVIPSWRQFWPTLRDQWKQFGVYLLVRFVLQLGVGIAQSIVLLVLGGVVVVAALLVGLLVVSAFGGFGATLGSVGGTVALVVLGLLTLVALLVVSLPIQILVQSYFTAYELSVLGAANGDFALLPERPDGGNEGDDSVTQRDDGDDSDDGHGGLDGRSQRDRGPDSSGSDDFVWGDDSTSS